MIEVLLKQVICLFFNCSGAVNQISIIGNLFTLSFADSEAFYRTFIVGNQKMPPSSIWLAIKINFIAPTWIFAKCTNAKQPAGKLSLLLYRFYRLGVFCKFQ